MKKTKYLILIISTLLILTSCNKKQKIGDILNIDENDIEKIVVSTTLIYGRTDILLDQNQYKDLLDKFTDFEVKEIEEDHMKGWLYSIDIETKTGDLKTITFRGDDKVYLNSKLYICDSYDRDFLLYLFDAKTQ